MDLNEEAIRNTYEDMLVIHPDQKSMLDLMLKARLKSIGITDEITRT